MPPDQQVEPVKPSYSHDLKFILLVSAAYFGSAGMIILLAITAQPMIAWFLLPYGLAFPFYVSLILGKLLSTYTKRGHAKSSAWVAFALGLLTTAIMLLDTSKKLAHASDLSISYAVETAWVCGLLAILLAILTLKRYKLLGITTIILGSSFVWLGAVGSSLQYNRLGEQIKQTEQDNIQLRADRVKAYDDEIKQFNTPIFIPPMSELLYLEKENNLALYNIDGYSSIRKLSFSRELVTDQPIAIVALRYDGRYSAGSTFAILETRVSGTYAVNTETKVCGVFNTNSFPTCKYLLTTPGGALVAFTNYVDRDGVRTPMYFVQKDTTYFYFKDPDGVINTSDRTIATFIDSLVPATGDRFTPTNCFVARREDCN